MPTGQRPIGLWIDPYNHPPVAEQIWFAVISRLENDVNGAFLFHFRNLEKRFSPLCSSQGDRFCAGPGFGIRISGEFYLIAIRIG